MSLHFIDALSLTNSIARKQKLEIAVRWYENEMSKDNTNKVTPKDAKGNAINIQPVNQEFHMKEKHDMILNEDSENKLPGADFI